MKFPCLALAALFVLPAIAADSAPAPSSSPVAILRFQDAVIATQEGQRAVAALKAKFDPRKAELEKRGAELEALHQKSDTTAPDARTKIQGDFDRRSRVLQHDVESLNAELEQDEAKILQDMSVKMSDVIRKYAARNGYKLVLDVSSQQTAVVWAHAAANISVEIVKAYDEVHPVQSAR